MMQPGSRVPGLLPPASPRHYRSVCLPVHLSACLSICMSGCKSIQADAAVRLSLHSAVGLSVCCLNVRLSVRLSVYPSICLSVCLPISLPAYVSVRSSAYLSYCPCCLSVCPRERWGIPGIPYRDAVQRLEPRCRVLPGASPSADVPGMIGS